MTAPVLGTLPWSPAVDHPELLAPVVAEAITALGLDVWVAAIDPELADTAAFCDAYEVSPDASANCVVVSGRRGETTTLAACLVLARDRADVNKVVRKHLDVRKISFADSATATGLSSMEYGGITPIGLPADWPVLVDEQVASQPWLVIGSGNRGSKICCSGATVASLPSATVLALARAED